MPASIRILKITAMAGTTHVLASIVPFLAFPSTLTAFLPYQSYFGVASLLHRAGLPVIGPFQEGMFMAGLTLFGQCAVYATWCLAYVTIALVCVAFTRRRN